MAIVTMGSSHDRIGVLLFGAGHMGQIHARRIQSSNQLTLVGIVDHNQDRGESLARPLGVPWASRYDEMPTQAAAAIIAVPTREHYWIAEHLLHEGLNVLVEKPLAGTLAEAEQLAIYSRELGHVLQVGHVEWFNPTLQAARSRIYQPKYFQIVREGALRPSTADVDVVWDLMLHDLHILLELLDDGLPIHIEAHGEKVECDTTDRATVRMEFANGCIADLHANRVSHRRVRTMVIEQEREHLLLNFLTHQLTVSRNAGNRTPLIVPTGHEQKDAVEEEHAAFVRAIHGRPETAVSAERVLSSLRVAARISELLSRTLRSSDTSLKTEDQAAS